MVSPSGLTQSSELDLFSLPLVGRSLIEASAGTGKTYSLAFVYLRLLLGIGQNNYHRALSVDEILVVTFTTAATEELRYRIRQNIHQLRLACLVGHHDDQDYQQLIDLIDDKPLALRRLLYAEQNMDEAAIFTIHSFCQRILTTYAFEAGILLKQTLVKDESALYLQVASDVWRDYFTPLPEDIVGIIWQTWRDPQDLLNKIKPYLNRRLPDNITLSSEPLDQRIVDFHQASINKIEKLKQDWLVSVDELQSLIQDSGVSKRSYSKSNLPKWLDKVTLWAQSPTIDYHYPVNELSKFSQIELNLKTDADKAPPVHRLFCDIEQFLTDTFDLSNFILFDLVHMITERAANKKMLLAQMGFNDLLNNLHKALLGDNGELLAQQISKQYPAAMIDEFQDTDAVQYQIFDTIYQDHQQSCLLLIGDPKQAIYGFRGADIFTYIQAKSSVDHQFTMLTNWRSSANMVAATNSLFNRRKQPFIFDAIPFIEMKSAKKNSSKAFYVNDHEVSALQSYLLPQNISSKGDYREYSAEYCAEQISQWLSQEAYFVDDQQLQRKLQSADIAILVRTGSEAELIQQKLNKRNIKSVYLSNHKSVFDTLEARELLRILQAVFNPTSESYLRSALATQLIGASMADLDALSNEQNVLEQVVEEFREYHTIWLRYGILVMLRRLMTRRRLIENLLSLTDGERIITNFMHLGELLQEVSPDIDTPHGLIRWLTKQIKEPDLNLENHEQRLESDENLINIITIHKSKGLEYPIVFLPFIGDYRESDSLIYHDRKNYNTNYAYSKSLEIDELIEQERLAEDLRLLYVAMTRSIYHCSIGIAGITKGRSTELVLKSSAIGYLLFNTEDYDYKALKTALEQLAYCQVLAIDIPIAISVFATRLESSNVDLVANQFKRKLDYSWRVTSYSSLIQSSSDDNKTAAFLADMIPAFDNEVLLDNRIIDEVISSTDDQVIYDIHHFPKGAIVGTLLHECFENSDFTQLDQQNVATHLITKLNLSPEWFQPLCKWFVDVLHTPLEQYCSLSDLSLAQRLNELQFYLPIRKEVSALTLDQLCKHYDPLSRQCDELTFAKVQGMLKGFIDMVFEWQGKYYIVDYKSNYLGESVDDYHIDAVNKAMCEHRYDLQYQLYSLALHRYLKSRITHYQYQSHFGGIYYLFIRGMTPNNPQHGVFYTKPEFKFIEELDKLFG